MAKIIVALETLSGDSAELEVDGDCDVLKLAQSVEMLWKIPQRCIKLTVGDTALGTSSWGDYEKIRDHCQAGSSIAISVIISLDGLLQLLEPLVNSDDDNNTWDCENKMEALTALAMLGPRANDDMIAAAAVHLSSPHLSVRRLTGLTLAAMVTGSDNRRCTAVNAIKPYLDNVDDDVRCASIEALGQVADRGDRDTVAAVAANLDNPSYEVKCSALKTLGGLAPLGDKETILKITPYLECIEYSNLWYSAVAALETIAGKGDEALIDVAMKLAESKDAGIKSSAIMLLGKASLQGDMSTVRMLSAFCKDISWYVHRVAVEALATVAHRGDECALAAVRQCLQDRDDSVRHAAAQASVALESPV